jgi:hypothetical protein
MRLERLPNLGRGRVRVACGVDGNELERPADYPARSVNLGGGKLRTPVARQIECGLRAGQIKGGNHHDGLGGVREARKDDTGEPCGRRGECPDEMHRVKEPPAAVPSHVTRPPSGILR